MLAKAKKGLANTETPNLDIFLPEKNIKCTSGYYEKKIIFSKTCDDIRRLDGIHLYGWRRGAKKAL
jgi:hypothetical protein